ncbi:hypothetical protein AKJ16_DCAP09680 [Drosera capensis]
MAKWSKLKHDDRLPPLPCPKNPTSTKPKSIDTSITHQPHCPFDFFATRRVLFLKKALMISSHHYQASFFGADVEIVKSW